MYPIPKVTGNRDTLIKIRHRSPKRIYPEMLRNNNPIEKNQAGITQLGKNLFPTRSSHLCRKPNKIPTVIIFRGI